MTGARFRLRQRFGSFVVHPGGEYWAGRRMRSPLTIESATGTVLFKAYSFATEQDARDIVALLNEAVGA